VAAAKFVAALATGSSALMAEGIHSVVDTGNELLLLVGIVRSRRAPDAVHPFGYGMELYFWSLLVAVVLFGIGGGMAMYEGVVALFETGPLKDPVWNYCVLGVSFFAEGASWVIATRALRRGRRTTNLWHSMRRSKDPSKFLIVGEDSAALAGLLVALIGTVLAQWFDSHVPDAVASMVIGLILCGTAVFLVMETKELLIGESARQDLIADVLDTVRAQPLIADVNHPLTMHLGPDQVLVNLDICFHREASLEAAAACLRTIEAAVCKRHPRVKYLYVHLRAA